MFEQLRCFGLYVVFQALRGVWVVVRDVATVDSRSARAASRHSRTGTALLIDERLHIGHDLLMGHGGARIV